MEKIVSYLKFLLKVRVIASARALLLRLWSVPPSTAGWENRLLIVNLEALGDLVVFTSVLKYYKKRFPEKKIYLLIKKGFGIEHIFKNNFADEVFTLDYRQFSVNPFYGAEFLNSLRRIGFHTVINQDWSAAEIMGKFVAVSLGAAEVIGYEGLGVEFAKPFDVQQRQNLKAVMEEMYPRYSRLIPSIDATRGFGKVWPSALRHYVAIYEGATGFKEADYSTTLPSGAGDEQGSEAVSRFGLTAGRYVLLGIGASVAYKRWPLERFYEVARAITKKELDVVLVGTAAETGLADCFEKNSGVKCVNTVGRTSIHDLVALVDHAGGVVTNDSGLVHIAVALKVPSLCMIGGGQFGMFSDYGGTGNRWIHRETDCYGDNWHCGRTVPPGAPSPCVAAISTESVLEELRMLLEHPGSRKRAGGGFLLGAAPEPPTIKSSAKLKVLYSGIQAENYNSQRMPSFEHANFYGTLQQMKEVAVKEYPYEPILGMGKKWFNEKLLKTIREEKPDLFFAFMFTDELDKKALQEIKTHTRSLAWYADDHWRLYNYSRRYAPFFSWNVTTWSKAPEIYKKYGITNVLRSQWAANHRQWKPVDTPRDINVSFVGQYNPARAALVNKLRAAGIDVYVRGWGWPEGRLSHEGVVKSFSRSKINLNFSVQPSRMTPKFLGRILFRRSVDKIVPDFWNVADNLESWVHMPTPQIKARPFEILACRTFLISTYADDMDKYYEDGKEIVYYRSFEDMIKKIHYYLTHTEERERIAQAGYEKTLANHTYEKRFKEIFEAIGLKL